MSGPLHRLTHDTLPRWNESFSNYCYRSSRYFYLVLAIILSFVIAILSFFESDFASFDEGTFDTIMKMRWASPSASKDIVILDIDEKSLAEMASEYGRWPWKRDVFARVLAELEYVEAKSIMFTVLIAEPDKEHPRSDDALSYVASESFVTVYPVVRLPQKNDQYSKLKVCDLIPAGVLRCNTDATVAAILPALPGMQHDLAIMNNHIDADGILRKWSVLWDEEAWKMPSMVGGALSLAHIKPKVDPNNPYIINWRIKKNSYQRISLADYMAALDGGQQVAPDYFKDKHVIIASSAPGLTIKQSTSLGLIDDGEILATAMDDALNGTDLKKLPKWIVILVSVVYVWGMALLFTFGRSQKILDRMFIVMQVVAMLVMVLAINYTTFFMDFMPTATFGLIFYSIARFHHEKGESVFTGTEAYLARFVLDEKLDSVAIMAFSDDDYHVLPSRNELVAMQRGFDAGRVFTFNSSFEDSKLLEQMNYICCAVVVASADKQLEMQQQLLAKMQQRGLEEHVVQTFKFPHAIMHDRALIPHFIAIKTLAVMTQLPYHYHEDE
ncbi:CHASE2 domain-containing protein [Mariprofundus sp. EBB-1]|uniref:CHASE2 domain-containing protein n=1 Tax=Mariprofundus sp. EBB-1 TaxID=2650971 RepID=UPI000EF24A9A|nr:CHASE2 domain-containing protein [Mariprofundus sp. EBB-1]RLL55901.1 CHASE2 domain-containing protein [Mariprofundus sp. EBB-1]